MVRRFRYHATPNEVKEYLAELGYATEDHYSAEDKQQVTGFGVVGTDISLSLDIVVQHPITGDLVTAGYGMIGLHINPFHPEYTSDRAEESRKLYRKLYRRFHKSPEGRLA